MANKLFPPKMAIMKISASFPMGWRPLIETKCCETNFQIKHAVLDLLVN